MGIVCVTGIICFSCRSKKIARSSTERENQPEKDDNEEESSSETIETIESGKLEGKTVDTVSLLSDKTQVFKGTLTWWTWGETKTWFMEDEYKSNNLYVSKLTPASLLEQTQLLLNLLLCRKTLTQARETS